MEEIAAVYARSLFEVAKEQGKLDEVRDQLGEIADAVSSTRELQTFFFSPYFSTQEKEEGLEKAVTGADEVVVECAFGGGEPVVSGEVKPDRYRVADGRIRARAAGAIRTLRDDELGDVVGLVRRAEEGFARPVDVEFCFDRRELWLLQCRPITTL